MGNIVVCCSSLEAPEAAEDQPEVQANLEHLPVLPRSLSETTLPPTLSLQRFRG